MLRRLLTVLVGGASGACGFAALGLGLYAGGPASSAATTLFAVVGGGCGALCAVLQLQQRGLPALPQDDAHRLNTMVRATLASAATERQPRTGSAADRRPAASDAAVPPAQPLTPPSPRPTGADDRRFASSAFGA